MSKINGQTGKRYSIPLVIALTAVVTMSLTAGGVYFLFDSGMGGALMETVPSATDDQGRKIAYWRAPMNPTEIYDKPGKSAMGMDLVPVYEDKTDDGVHSGDASGRTIAYWRAPMNPTEVYDKPGKSAMGMDLVPVYEDELVGGVAVTVDPVIQQNMGLRTAIVVEKPLERTIRTYGHITADETRTTQINLKTGGWVEKLYVDYTGMYVEKGQPLFEIYSPELLAAQEEYLSAFKSIGSRMGGSGKDLLRSARRRLEYFDVSAGEIQDIQALGRTQKTLVIRSPFTGYVIDRNVEKGSYVKEGTTIFRIADLSNIWVEAHVYEYELPWIREGLLAEMTLPYAPGRVFPGRVSFVYPYLQPKTRDIVIRLEFANPDMKLKPDMYADVRIRTATEGTGMVIPAEAVIRSGERNLVFVTRDDNKFTPRDVTLGPTLDDGMVQILSGLAPSEVIVTSGQFLLDSESKLKEAVQKMLEAKRAKTKTAGPEPSEPEGFFDDMDQEEDFFEDVEEGEDFVKDLED